MRKTRLRLGAVFGLVGLLLLALAAFFWVDHARFEESAVRGEGKVIGHSETSSQGTSESSRTVSYWPVVTFEVPGDGYFTFTDRDRSGSPTPPVGTTVEVLYPPGNPREARVNGTAGPIPLISAGFGGLLLLVGGLLLVAGFRRPDRPRDYVPPSSPITGTQ